jgi:thiol:disulfide interchange protein
MSEMVLRLALVVLICVFAFALVWLGRRFVDVRRQSVINAAPLSPAALSPYENSLPKATTAHPTRVRILAFSSEDCRQCHTHQAPVLRRIVEAKGEEVVSVINIDAPSSPELMQRYQVLTVPTTVLLDAHGKVHAVNHGFTNAYSLLRQVDAVLAQDGVQEALS